MKHQLLKPILTSMVISTFVFTFTPKTTANATTATDSSIVETADTSNNTVTTISDDILNSAKQVGIYKNKIVFSFNAIEGVSTYHITFGDKETFISNTENLDSLSSSFAVKKGTEITSDINIYPLLDDFVVDSPVITIKASDLKLIPVAPSKVTVSEAFPSLGDVIMSFNRAAYADGIQYKVYKSGSKVLKKKTIKYKKDTTKVGYSTINGITNSKFYKVKIRSYTTFNRKKKYGSWEVRYITNQVNLSGESNGNNNCISLKWDKIKGAKNYTIYASTNSKKSFKKIATLKGNSKNIKKVAGKKLSSGKRYYFYVVANKKSGGKTYTSPLRYSLDITYIK